MRNPLFFRENKLLNLKRQLAKIPLALKNNKRVFTLVMIVIIGLSARIWNTQPVSYAYASDSEDNFSQSIQSPLFEQLAIFTQENAQVEEELSPAQIFGKTEQVEDEAVTILREKLYEIVGDAPIREMVPFISQRDEVVAAFLVGIAKKESSLGIHSPRKDGENCYNYWGYKGSAGRGTGMGYACFASAEEAVKIVGDRIEVLVNKDRNTPARMVNTWKCGTSCVGDPGAPSWIATVALYFDKIVS
jgi:hypothetical protein